MHLRMESGLSGYDFIDDRPTANDGNGRDSDPSDPGDWTSANECSAGEAAAGSSWHGTQVSGLIGAATNNGIGMAGAGRNVMVLPVRVLGQCGSGYDSDIIAGMRWAAGLSNDRNCSSTATRSATCNPNPARVINMSLGGSGSCSASYQSAVTELVNAGVVVVVASGNQRGHAVNSPANCNGAIAVAGVRHAGTKVGYSNLGTQIAIAAPAGNCINTAEGSECLYPLMTTVNLGSTTPGESGYSDSFNHPSLGTSFAAPLVAGTVALMRSLDATLTPAQVKTYLQGSARSFPSTGGTDDTVTACRPPSATDQLECYCTATTCGAGMLDTAGAVTLVQQALAAAPTAAISVSSSTPTAGQTVTLDGSGSSASSGRTIVSHAWAITSGAGLASFTGATNGSTATLLTSGAGSVTVSLTVTDSAGVSRSTSSSITVAAAPVGSTPGTSSTTPSAGGGGGALGLGWLLGLGLATAALARRPGRR